MGSRISGGCKVRLGTLWDSLEVFDESAGISHHPWHELLSREPRQSELVHLVPGTRQFYGISVAFSISTLNIGIDQFFAGELQLGLAPEPLGTRPLGKFSQSTASRLLHRFLWRIEPKPWTFWIPPACGGDFRGAIGVGRHRHHL